MSPQARYFNKIFTWCKCFKHAANHCLLGSVYFWGGVSSVHSGILKPISLLQTDNLSWSVSLHYSTSVYTVGYQDKCPDDAARCEDFNCQEEVWAACTRCLAFLDFDHFNTGESGSSHSVYSEFYVPDFTSPQSQSPKTSIQNDIARLQLDAWN